MVNRESGDPSNRHMPLRSNGIHEANRTTNHINPRSTLRARPHYPVACTQQLGERPGCQAPILQSRSRFPTLTPSFPGADAAAGAAPRGAVRRDGGRRRPARRPPGRRGGRRRHPSQADMGGCPRSLRMGGACSPSPGLSSYGGGGAEKEVPPLTSPIQP